MTPQDEEAQRLIALARRDALAMSVLAANDQISVSLVGFHAQQAVEKAFKAVLLRHGVAIRRTHDLFELAAMLEERGLQQPLNQDMLQCLGRFAVEYRYDDPGEYPLTSSALIDAAQAALAACAIMLKPGV